MTEISLIEVYRIVDSFFKYFEGNFLVEHFARNYYGKRGFKRYLSMKDIIHAVLKLKGTSPIRKRIFEGTISQFSEL